jgi:hypothetical protein
MDPANPFEPPSPPVPTEKKKTGALETLIQVLRGYLNNAIDPERSLNGAALQPEHRRAVRLFGMGGLFFGAVIPALVALSVPLRALAEITVPGLLFSLGLALILFYPLSLLGLSFYLRLLRPGGVLQRWMGFGALK